MDAGSGKTRFARFGIFRLDKQTKELVKAGRKIKLHGQPLEILLALVDRPGEVISRSELQKRLWAENTYVDFEHGLNKAVSKIRIALDDSAENPRFLETIPGEGYRFIAHVVWLPATPEGPTVPSGEGLAETAIAEHGRNRMSWVGAAAGVLLLGLAVGWYYFNIRSRSHIAELKLTSRVPEDSIEAASISPDGKYIAFADQEGLWLQFVNKREMHKLEAPAMSAVTKISWLPDSAAFLLSATSQSEKISALWEVSIFGGQPRKLREDAGQGTPTIDGSTIAFTTGDAHEIWKMRETGEGAQRIAVAGTGDQFGGLVWSSDGASLIDERIHESNGDFAIYLEWRSLSTGKTTTLVTEPGLRSFCGTRDGTIIYSRMESPRNTNDTNLWRIRVDSRTGRVVQEAEKITGWSGYSLSSLSITADGKQLAVAKGFTHLASYAVRLDTTDKSQAAVTRLTFHERDDYPGAWDPASRAVFLNSNRDGAWEIFKQGVVQHTAQYVVGSAENAKYPILSPDGRWILYEAVPRSNTTWSTPIKVLRVPVAGGPPQEVWVGNGFYRVRCGHSAGSRCVLCKPSQDGKHIMISEFDPLKGLGKELGNVSTTITAARLYLSWALSPDGSQIVVSEPGDTGTRLRVISLASLAERNINVAGWRGFQTISWAADGKSFFLLMGSQNGSTILRVNSEGRAQVLLERNRAIDKECVPSPDGRWLAFAELDSNTNVTLLKGF